MFRSTPPIKGKKFVHDAVRIELRFRDTFGWWDLYPIADSQELQAKRTFNRTKT